MKKLIQILNILGLGAVVYINYLAVTLPLGGRTTGEISESFPNLFVPAGITFSIWGLIYLALLGFVIFQASSLFNPSVKDEPWFSKIGFLFFLSFLSAIVSFVVIKNEQYSEKVLFPTGHRI